MTKRLAFIAAIILFSFAQPARADSFLCRIFGIGCPNPNALPPFVPKYEQNVLLISPFKPPTPLNEWYFATAETAEEVCRRLECQAVRTRPECSMGGAPNTCTSPEREIAFVDIIRNAGIYASYWTRNPENEFPGLALKLAKMQLAAERNQQKKSIRLAKARARIR